MSQIKQEEKVVIVSKQAAKAVATTVFALVLAVGVDPVLAWLALAGRMTLLYIYILYGLAVAIAGTVWVWRYLLRDLNEPPPHRRIWGMK